MGKGKEKAKRYCICKSVKTDDQMIACDKCDEWYHLICIKMKKEDIPEGDYFCDKCKRAAKQCNHPTCTTEARSGSKYCSDECGLAYNKMRYLKHFRPKMDRLQKTPSKAYTMKGELLEDLENKKAAVIERIGQLRTDRDELEKKLIMIKEHAKDLASQANQTKDQDMDDSGDEDEDDVISSDQAKMFCVCCGVEQQADKDFKHWQTCYKKQESSFISYLTTQLTLKCDTDPDPGIFCRQFVDKKRGWFCPNLEIMCPLHSNWNPAEGEVCGCPLRTVQDLDSNASYCLKPKKDCTKHYHWDRFRLAIIDYERANSFQRLQKIEEEIIKTQERYNDHYGGVIGVMLHNTIVHTVEEDVDVDDSDEKMVEV